MTEQIKKEALELLKSLIATPSVSRNEEGSADVLLAYLSGKGVAVNRHVNNLWAYNNHFDKNKPTVLLCSHHDTVPPVGDYTRNPYLPTEEEGRVYGLGSNDAGASLICLTLLFLHYLDQPIMPYNLCLLLSAEEEISGANGVRSVLDKIGDINLAVVGEPTGMEMAIAERGLMVLDCYTQGKSGHAAHNNTINPIVKALADLRWFSEFRFPKVSKMSGEVKMSVTIINSGEKHNVIPSECKFTVDVRTNDQYSNIEILNIIHENVSCKVTPRSTHLCASGIAQDHPFVQCASKNGHVLFGSATLSDQALLPFDSVKIGVGDSLRSHTADEYIEVRELEEGYDKFIKLFEDFFNTEQL